MAPHATIPAGRDLTTGYLRHLAETGTDPATLAAAAVTSEPLAVAYRDRFLPCPVFLEPGERGRLAADLLSVQTMLTELPERLFNGSRVVLARALEFSDLHTAIIERAPAGRLTALARADLYRVADGFKLLEHNITSALGGFENADINRAMLEHGALSAFTEARALGFSDTLRAEFDTMMFELGDRVTGRRPVVAIVDSPRSYATFEPRLRGMAAMFEDLGVDAITCHIGQFAERDGGGVRVGDRDIDVVYRFFLLDEILTQEHYAMLEPVMAAVERDEVLLFSRIDAELFGNKGALAMLSDDRNAAAFSDTERDRLRRFLPWTRFVLPKATDPEGAVCDLTAYAIARREDLILKPVNEHGGSGIVAGWQVDAARWAAEVAAAMKGPYVIQERVRPEPEPMPATSGYQDYYLNWGVFIADPRAIGGDGYAGCIVRGSTDAQVGVVSMGDGALVGCCFHPVLG